MGNNGTDQSLRNGNFITLFISKYAYFFYCLTQISKGWELIAVTLYQQTRQRNRHTGLASQ
jgi:hypothetical protein